VRRLAERLGEGVRLARQAVRIRRLPAGVEVRDSHGTAEVFDHVVIGTHADQALALLEQPTPDEQALLGAFRYSRNLAVLHSDVGLMPRRRRAWASWNYLGVGDGLCVSYWMNRLQGLPGRDLFVTLNPPRPPRAETLLRSEIFEHPIFDAAAVRAQESLWSLQGQGGVWYCGAWFGAGFHEDGLQAGLAVAEALGGVRRPWTVANESGRIHLGPARKGALEAAA
jgi:predicted NAD/FAD-binding protein